MHVQQLAQLDIGQIVPVMLALSVQEPLFLQPTNLVAQIAILDAQHVPQVLQTAKRVLDLMPNSQVLIHAQQHVQMDIIKIVTYVVDAMILVLHVVTQTDWIIVCPVLLADI